MPETSNLHEGRQQVSKYSILINSLPKDLDYLRTRNITDDVSTYKIFSRQIYFEK